MKAHRRGAKNAEKMNIFLSAERARKKKSHILKSLRHYVIMDVNKLSSKIIGAAIEMHNALGPGLLESVYEECICYELSLQDFSLERPNP